MKALKPKHIIIKVLFASLLCLLLIAPGFSGTKTLTFYWEQPSTPDLKGWTLYWGTSSRNYTDSTSFDWDGNPEATYTKDFVLTSPDGQTRTYFFALTARDSFGNESGFSNEVNATVDFEAPGVPLNLRVTIKVN